MADHEIEALEQQKIIEHLKSMIRERDEAFQTKEKELQDVNAKLSKMKLQAKAKLAKEAKEAKEGKASKSVTKEPKDKQESAAGDKNVDTEEESHSQVVRAKTKLLRKKLEESDRQLKDRDETIVLKDQQIEVKEKVIGEREEVIQSLTRQLEDKYKLMEELHANSSADEATDAEARVRQMYAQIVYKDKNLLELNNKILELERKMIDLQEFIGEKNEVIRGRDKVIELIQTAMKEKDQNMADQARLISKLTSKVETNDETLDKLREEVEKAEHNLKTERDRFHLRLTESQKYFEETLKEQEETVAKLQKSLQDKEGELLVSQNDLRELIQRHERDIQKIMSTGEVNLQDPVIQMLEQKMKDTNEVLEGKIQVIEVLQRESSQKEKEVNESREIQKSFKEKLQVMSEQMMLFQANQVDLETQWIESRKKYEERIKDLVEKHETELTEKEIQIQNLRSNVSQMETAYNQSLSQYSVLQERYQQNVNSGGALPLTKTETTQLGASPSQADDRQNIVEELESQVESLRKTLKEKEKQSEELDCLKQKSESLNAMLVELEGENQKLQTDLARKDDELASLKKSAEEASGAAQESSKGDTKMLKMKAQLTSKVKSLEKEIATLKKKSKMSDEIDTIKKELAAIAVERDELKQKLGEMDGIEKLHEEAMKKLTEFEAMLSLLKAEKSQIEADKEAITSEKEELSGTLAELRDSLEQTNTVIKEHEKMLSSQEKEIEEQTVIITNFQEEFKTMKDQLETEKSMLEELSSQKESLGKDKDEANAQIKDLIEEKERLLSKLETLSDTATGTDETLIAYQEKNEVLNKKVDELEDQLSEISGLNKTQKEELNNLTQTLTNSNEEKLCLESEISTLNANIGDLENRLKELQTVKEEQDIVIKELNDEVDLLKHEVDQKVGSLKDSSDKFDSLKNEIETLQVKFDESTQDLEAKGGEIDTLRADILSMNAENEALKHSINQFESDITVFIHETCDIHDSCDLSTARTYVSSLQSSNCDLKASISNCLTQSSSVKSSALQIKSELVCLKQTYFDNVSKMNHDFKNMTEALLSYEKIANSQDDEMKRNMAEIEQLTTTIGELKALIEEKDLQCKQQSREIEILREGQSTKGSEYESKMQSLLEDITELEHQISDANMKKAKTMDALEQMENKCSDLESELKCEKERNSTKIVELSNELGETKRNIMELNEEIDKKKLAYSSLQEEECILMERLKVAEQDKNTLRIDLEKTQTNESYLTDKCSEAAAEIESMQKQNDHLKTTVDKLTKDICEIQDNFNQEITEKKQISHKLLESNEVMKAETAESNTKIVQLQSEIDMLNSKFSELNNEKEELFAKVQLSENALLGKQEELDDIYSRLNDKIQECDQLEKDVNLKCLNVQSLTGDIQDINSKLFIAVETSKDLEKQLEVLQGQKEELDIKCNSQSEALLDKEGALVILTDEISALKERYNSEHDGIRNQIICISKELEETKKQKSFTEEKVLDLQQQIGQLEDDNTTLHLQESSKHVDGANASKQVIGGTENDESHSFIQDPENDQDVSLEQRLRDQIEEMETKIIDVTLMLEDRDNEIKKLAKANENLSSHCKWIEQQLEALPHDLIEDEKKDMPLTAEQHVSSDNQYYYEKENHQDLQLQMKQLTYQLLEKDQIIQELQNDHLKENSFDTDGESDFKDFCDKLENEKEKLKEKLRSQEQLLKKKEGMIQSLGIEIERMKDSSKIAVSTDSGVAISDNIKESLEFDTSSKQNNESVANEEVIVHAAEPPVSLSLNSSLLLVSSEKESSHVDNDDESNIQVLRSKLVAAIEERNKYKSDNKKLIKLGKGKETKLRLMAENFEQLRKERDELLAERDSLENKVQDLSSTFISDFENKEKDQLKSLNEELTRLSSEKDKQMEELQSILDKSASCSVGDRHVFEINSLSRENEKLKMEAKKLQQIGKGKTATIMKNSQDFETALKEKEAAIKEKGDQIVLVESLLTEAREDIESLKLEMNKVAADYSKIQKVAKGKDAKVKKMEGKVKEKETEINKLSDDNTRLQEQLERLNLDLDALNEKERNLEEELQGSHDKTKELERKCKELDEKIHEMEETLAQKDNEISSLNDNQKLMQRLSEERIILEFELNCARQELDTMKTSLGSEELKMQEINTSVSKVIKEKDVIIAESNIIKENLQEISPCGVHMTENSTENDDTSRMSFQELKSKIAGLLSDNKKLQQEKNKIDKLSKGKEAKVKHMEAFIGEQQKMLSEKDTDVLIMQESIKDMHSKIGVLEEVDTDLRYRLDNALADLDEWKTHCNALEDQIDDLHEAIDKKNGELLNLEEDMSVAREEIDHLLLDKDELMKDREQLLSDLEKYETLVKVKEDEVKSLREEIENINKEKEQLEIESKKIQMLMKGKDAKIKKLEKHQHAFQDDLQEKDSMINLLEKEIKEITSKLHQSEDTITELQSRCRELTYNNSQTDQSLTNARLEIDQLTVARGQTNEMLHTYEEKMKELQNYLESLQENVLNKENNLSYLQNELLTKERIIEEQNEKLLTLTEDNKTLENLNSEQSKELEQLTLVSQSMATSIKEIQSEVDKGASDITGKEHELKQIRQDNTQKDSIVHNLSLKIKENETYIVDLKSQLEEEAANRTLLEQKLKLYDGEQFSQKEIIGERNDAVEALKQRCDALEKEFNNNLITLQAKDKDISTLRGKLLQAEEMVTELSSQVENKERSVKHVQEELRISIESKDDFESRISRLYSELENKSEEIISLQSTLEHALSENRSIKLEKEKETDQLKQAIDTLNDESKIQKERVVWFEQCCSDLHMKVKELEMCLDNHKTDLKESQESVSLSREEIAKVQIDFESKRDECYNLSKRVEELNHVIDEHVNQMDTLEKESKQKEIRIGSLEQLAETEHQEAINLQENNERLHEELSHLHKELKAIRTIKSNTQNSESISGVVTEKAIVYEEMKVERSLQQGSSRPEQVIVDDTSVADISSIEKQILGPILAKPVEKGNMSGQSSPDINRADNLKTEIKKLKQLCKGKDAKIKKLEASISKQPVESKSTLEPSEKESSVLQEKLNDLESVLLHTQEDRDRSLLQNEEMKSNIDLLKDSIQKLEIEKQEVIASNKNEIDRLNRLSLDLQLELDDSKMLIDNTNDLLQTSQNQLEALNTQFNETYATQTKATNELKDEISKLRSELADVNERYELVLKQSSETESMLALKDQELQPLKELMKEKMNEIDDLKKTNQVLMHSGEGLASEKQRFESLLKNEKEEIQSLYEQMNQLVSEKLDLECNIEQKDRDLRKAADELKKFAADRDNLDQLLERKDELQLECETLSRDVQELRTRLTEKEKQVQSSNEIIEQKGYQINQLKEEIQMTSEIRQQSDDRYKSVLDQVELAHETVEIISSELNSKKIACSKLNEMCEGKDALIESLKSNMENFSAEIEKYEHSISNLQAEITLYKEQLQTQTLNNHELQHYQRECENMTKQIAELHAHLAHKEENMERLENKATNKSSPWEHGQVKEVINQETLALTTAECHVEQIQQESQHEMSGNDSLNSDRMEEIRMLNAENKELHTQLETAKEEIASKSRLEEKLKQKDESIKSLLENMQEMEERLTQLSEAGDVNEGQEIKVKELESEIEKLQKTVNEKELKFTKALATAKKIKIQLNQTAANLETEKKEKDELQRQLRTMETGAEDPNHERNVSEKTALKGEDVVPEDKVNEIMRDLQNQLQTYAEFSQQLQDQVQELANKLHTSENSLQQLKEEKSIIKEEKDSLVLLNQEGENVAAALRKELEDARMSLKNNCEMMEEKEKMNLLLQQELQHVSSLLQSAQSQTEIHNNEAMQSAVEAMERDVLTWKTKCGEMAEVIERNEIELSSLDNKIKDLEDSSHGYMNTIQMLQTELRASTTEMDQVRANLIEQTETRERLELVMNDLNKQLDGTENKWLEEKKENTKLEGEIDELKEMLREMEVNNSALKKDLEENYADLKEKSQMIQSLNTYKNESDMQMQERYLKLESSIENVQELTQTILEKEKDINSAQSEISRLEETISVLQCELKSSLQIEVEMKEKLGMTILETTDLKEQIISLKKDIDEKSLICENLKSSFDDKIKETEQLKDEKELIQSEATEYENTISSLTSELLSFKSNKGSEDIHAKETSKTEKENMLSECNQVKEELAAALVREATTNALKEIIGHEKDELMKSNSQLQTKLDENVALRETIELEISKYKRAIDHSKKEKENIQSQNRMYESETKEDYEAHLTKLQSDINTLKQENNNLSKQNSEIVSLHEDTKEEKECLTEQLNMLSVEKDSCKAEMDEAALILKQMKDENQRLTSDVKAMTSKLGDMSEKMVESKTVNDEIQKELDEFVAENNQLKLQISSLQSECEVVASQMAEFKSSFDQISTSHETIKSEYDQLLQNNNVLADQNGILKIENSELRKKIDELYDSHEAEKERMTGKAADLDQAVVQESLIERQELQKLEKTTLGSMPVVTGIDTDSVKIISNTEQERPSAEIEALQKQVADLTREKAVLGEKAAADSIKFEKMLAKLKTFKERNDSYQAEISELKQQLVSSDRKEQSSIKHLEHKCNELESHLVITEQKLIDETNKLHEKITERTELSYKCTKLTERNLQLEKEVETLEKVKNEMQQTLENQIDTIAKDKSLIGNKLSDMQNRNVELLEQIDCLRSELNLAEGALGNAKDMNQDLQKKVEDMEKKVESEHGLTLEKENNIQSMRIKLAAIETSMNEKEAREQMAQRQLKDMKDQYEMLEQDNKSFQDIISKSTVMNNDLKNENIQLKILNEKLQSQTEGIMADSNKVKGLETELSEIATDKKYLEEEMDGLREDVIQLKKDKFEVSMESNRNAEKVKELSLEILSKSKEIGHLKWKLDEMEGLEKDVEEVRKENDLLCKDKKDLENELGKLQNNLEILMNENEKQKFMLEVQAKKLTESEEIDNKLKESIDESESTINELSQQMDSQQEATVVKIKHLEDEVERLKEELETHKTENVSMKKQFDKANKQLQKVDMLKKEFETLSEENKKLLSDKSNLAKQTEELYFKLKEMSAIDQRSEVDMEHFDKARETLSKRIIDLEKETTELRNKNSEIMQEKSKLEVSLQQAEFDRDSKSLGNSENEHKYTNFQDTNDKLHKQFSAAIQQKNKLQTDINMAQRSSAQKEARCQQLAMQVNQLAQDRSYLNTQLGIMSKCLREKEQEIPQVQQQYRSLYQKYTALQTKMADQEKQAILDLIQQSPAPSSGSRTPIEGHITARTSDIQNLERSLKERKSSQSSNSDSQSSSMIEPLEISMRERLGEEIPEVEAGDGTSSIKGLQLMRQGNNSYLERIQRRLVIPSAVAPGKVDS